MERENRRTRRAGRGVRILPLAGALTFFAAPLLAADDLLEMSLEDSIRGFMQACSNKLPVMIDGRSLCTPLFGGLVWNEQNPRSKLSSGSRSFGGRAARSGEPTPSTA